ncbi:hypothetical protein GOODEAATRI_022561, partial [Goodea atripinnis]
NTRIASRTQTECERGPNYIQMVLFNLTGPLLPPSLSGPNLDYPHLTCGEPMFFQAEPNGLKPDHQAPLVLGPGRCPGFSNSGLVCLRSRTSSRSFSWTLSDPDLGTRLPWETVPARTPKPLGTLG